MKGLCTNLTFRLPLIAGLILASAFSSTAQGRLDSLETRMEQVYGLEKLQLLHQIIPLYLERKDDRKALRYARQAEQLAEDIIQPDNQLLKPADLSLKMTTYLLLGQAYQQRGQYMESKEAFKNAMREAQQFEASLQYQQAERAIQEIDSISAAAGKTRKKFLGNLLDDVSRTIDDATRDFGVSATLKLAEVYEDNNDFDRAITQYKMAANRLKDMGEWEQEQEISEHIADLMAKNGQREEARIAYESIMENKLRLEDSLTAIEIKAKMDSAGLSNWVVPSPPPAVLPPKPPKLDFKPVDVEKVETDMQNIRRFAERAESDRDFKRSLDYYKQYLALEQQLTEEKRMQELALLEQTHEIESREREILLLKQNEEINRAELQRQIAFKRNLFLVLALLGILGFTLFMLYRNKRRDHKKLGIAFENLAKAQDQLKAAEQRVKNLLDQHVSGAVANELLAAKTDSIVERRFVCIMFLDIRDFTPFAEKLNPEEIIEYQNSVFGFMIDTINKHGGIVNQIMGDGFMATFGAPVSAGNDCMEGYLAAREIMDTLQTKSRKGEVSPTRIGIGLHAGYVVTGNVGTESRKQYSITGNPVIIAARLEQLNKKFGSTLIISKDVYELLPENIRVPVEFSEVRVKGRSKPVAVAVF